MFETAELGHALKKSEYQELVPTLRTELVQLQNQLTQAEFPVLVVIEGDDRVGVHEAVNLVSEWMDPRFLGVDVYPTRPDEKADPEAAFPWFWRYWLRLPGRGHIGIFVNAWTLRTLLEYWRSDDRDELHLEQNIRHIRAFEKMLIDDGALLIKIWLHTPKAERKKRIKAADDDPIASWRVSSEDRTVYETYDKVEPLIERVLQRTSTGEAPWQVVESADALVDYLGSMSRADEPAKNRIRDHVAAQIHRIGAFHITISVALFECRNLGDRP